MRLKDSMNLMNITNIELVNKIDSCDDLIEVINNLITRVKYLGNQVEYQNSMISELCKNQSLTSIQLHNLRNRYDTQSNNYKYQCLTNNVENENKNYHDMPENGIKSNETESQSDTFSEASDCVKSSTSNSIDNSVKTPLEVFKANNEDYVREVVNLKLAAKNAPAHEVAAREKEWKAYRNANKELHAAYVKATNATYKYNK